MTEKSVDTQYGTPGKGARRRGAQGRRCDAPGCATNLSAYNASTTCYLYTQPATRTPLAPK
jgi:hypothetical protein